MVNAKKEKKKEIPSFKEIFEQNLKKRMPPYSPDSIIKTYKQSCYKYAEIISESKDKKLVSKYSKIISKLDGKKRIGALYRTLLLEHLHLLLEMYRIYGENVKWEKLLGQSITSLVSGWLNFLLNKYEKAPAKFRKFESKKRICDLIFYKVKKKLENNKVWDKYDLYERHIILQKLRNSISWQVSLAFKYNKNFRNLLIS